MLTNCEFLMESRGWSMKFELGKVEKDESGFEFQSMNIFDDDGDRLTPENYEIIMKHRELELLAEQNEHFKSIGAILSELSFHFRKEEESISKSIGND